MNKRTRGLLCVAGTTMGAGAALGQTPPVYFANVGGNPCCCRTCGSGESTGGAPLIVSLPPCTNEGSTYTGYARAMQSELEVAVGVLWTPQPAHFHCGTHGGVASTTQRDLIFSGPPGAGSVPVRFTMYVDGEVNAVNSSWHAAMQLGGSLGAVATCDSAGPGSCGAGGHLTVQSNLGTAPIGSAEQLVRSVTATATANDGTGSAGARVALRYHWQRVFDLPPGYTCNSVSAGIVNNRYVGTTAVTVETPQAYLSGMHEMAGNVAAEAVAGLPAVSAPNLSAVGNNLVFSNNPDLGAISVPVLNVVLGDLTVTLNPALGAVVLPVTEVGGNVDVSGNGAATNINVGSLTSAGDVDVSNNGSATHIDVGSLTTAGDVDVSNNGAATHIDVGSLTTSGDVDVSNNGSATNINVGSLASADGDVTISNNISAAIISLPSLTTGGGSVSVGGNTSASTIDLGSLTSAGGTVNVGGNTSASTIDLGSLTSVEGSVSVGGNTAASTIDLASLQTVGGDLSITDNPALTNLQFLSLTTVNGDLTVETSIQSSVDLAGVTIGGNLQFDTTNAATVSLSAPVGATQVSFCNSGACMGMTLPAAAMAQGAALSVARIAPQDLLPAPALDPEGDPVGVQPLAGYAFDNDDLPLAGAGTIVIDLELPGMTPAGRAAVLAAVAQGSLTVAVQEDDPDSPWHARRVCTTGTPIPDECAVVQLLDANHVPTADPVLAQVVRLTCACTHFSTYAAAMVVPRCGTADLGSQGGSPGSDGLLDNNDFVVFIDYFFNADARADFGIQGGVPGHDALFDNNDFVVFIDAFFNGCP